MSFIIGEKQPKICIATLDYKSVHRIFKNIRQTENLPKNCKNRIKVIFDFHVIEFRFFVITLKKKKTF